MSWWVCLIPSFLITDHMWVIWKKHQTTNIQCWKQSMEPGLSLYWTSVRSSCVPAFPCSHWPHPPLCHSPVPSCAALKFANSEYVTVSGENHFPSSTFMTLKTYTCFVFVHKTHLQLQFLGNLQRETKSKVLKVIEMQPLCLSLLSFISSWIRTRSGALRQILSSKSLSECCCCCC